MRSTKEHGSVWPQEQRPSQVAGAPAAALASGRIADSGHSIPSQIVKPRSVFRLDQLIDRGLPAKPAAEFAVASLKTRETGSVQRVSADGNIDDARQRILDAALGNSPDAPSDPAAKSDERAAVSSEDGRRDQPGQDLDTPSDQSQRATDHTSRPLATPPAELPKENNTEPVDEERQAEPASDTAEPAQQPSKPEHDRPAQNESTGTKQPGILQDLAEISRGCSGCSGRGCRSCLGPLLRQRPSLGNSCSETVKPDCGQEAPTDGCTCSECGQSMGLDHIMERGRNLLQRARDAIPASNSCSDAGSETDWMNPASPVLPILPLERSFCPSCFGNGCSSCEGRGILSNRQRDWTASLPHVLQNVPLPFSRGGSRAGCSSCTEPASGNFGSQVGCSGGESECGTSFGGWIAWGSYDNSHGIDGINGNRSLPFNNIAEEFQIHQIWMHVGRDAQTGEGLNFGYRLDFMFGTDGPDTQSFGDQSWDDAWDTSNSYGFALPQLYVEAAWQHSKILVGHFYTIIGYEVVQAPNNFFYSHAYTFAFNEPFTHTGVLLKNEVSDTLTIYNGWTAGWDTGFSNGNGGSVYLGGIGLAPHDDFSLVYSMSFGDPGDDPVNHSDTFLQSIVANWKLADRLEWVFQSDFQTRRSPVLDGKSYGVNNYLFYELTKQTKLGMRYEWFREGRGLAGLGGASEHFHALTFGVNQQLGEGLILRPEVRYDWVDRDDGFAGGPFANGTKRSQFAWGVSGVAKF